MKEVADRTQLARGYLEQMVVPLKNASLLRGISGRHGGYLLARPAEDIRIAQIIEAMIGPIAIVSCVNVPESCNRTDYCDCHLLWSLISLHIKEDLNAYTLADISSGDWRDTMLKQLAAYRELSDAVLPASVKNLYEENDDAARYTG